MGNNEQWTMGIAPNGLRTAAKFEPGFAQITDSQSGEKNQKYNLCQITILCSNIDLQNIEFHMCKFGSSQGIWRRHILTLRQETKFVIFFQHTPTHPRPQPTLPLPTPPQSSGDDISTGRRLLENIRPWFDLGLNYPHLLLPLLISKPYLQEPKEEACLPLMPDGLNSHHLLRPIYSH